MGLADSKHFLHIVRAMVLEPQGNAKLWAEMASVPASSAYRVLRPMQFHGAMAGGRVEPRALLRLAADLRKDRSMPHTNLRRTHIQESILLGKASCQLAFHSAANQYAFFEGEELSLRISPKDAEGLPRFAGGRGRRVNVYVDDLERYPAPTKIEGHAVADPIVTLIDLLSHPRAGAHAAFFDEVLTKAGTLPRRP